MANITFTEKNIHSIKFDLQCDVSLANAIRRTIDSEVLTVGFNTEPYEESDVKIKENTSSLHNEFIMHRFGMIPPHIVDVDKFDPSKYKFILDVQNKEKQIIRVTTKDIKIIDNDTNLEVDNSKFFKPNPITNDYILIIKLKPNPDGNGEILNLEARGSLGNGDKDARFMPSSCNTYQNKIDPVKYDAGLKAYIDDTQEKTIESTVEELTKRFSISEGERYFITDENDRPNVFEYTLDSIGVLPSHIILNKSLNILIVKLKQFIANFTKTLEGQSDEISIHESTGVMKGHEIIIHNESHTLGYLLQSYIQILYGDKVKFVGYRNPHPLKKFIELSISTESNNIEEIKDIIFNTAGNIIKLVEILKTKVASEYADAQKPKKRIIRKK